jgi:hypothetical protein
MNLSEALLQSICEFERTSNQFIDANDAERGLWLRELMIQDDGYKAAIQSSLDSICCDHEDMDCYSIWALCRSFEHERQLVIASAQALVGHVAVSLSENDESQATLTGIRSAIALHLKRFGIKGRYLVNFLQAIQIHKTSSPSTQHFDGEDFVAEQPWS